MLGIIRFSITIMQTCLYINSDHLLSHVHEFDIRVGVYEYKGTPLTEHSVE